MNIERGDCHILFAYDAARSIDLDDAAQRLHKAGKRHGMVRTRRAPSYFEYQQPPLRIRYEREPPQIGSFSPRPAADVVLYDFGAIAVHYTIPLEGPFENLLPLGEALYDNRLLLADSRKLVEQAVGMIPNATLHAEIAETVEDYVVFHIEALSEPIASKVFCSTWAREIAGILRCERRPLSEEEIADAISARVSYGEHDIAIVDWNAALLLDPEGDDVREVLQFANVELLEMRYLDRKLDRALEQSYEILAKRRHRLGLFGAEAKRVAEMQVDSAILFEGVNNALKLLGDQYLARAYRIVSRRFHLDDWDASILRKLQTLDGIYQKMSDQAAARRMETLEWIIILLFVVSIGLELLHFLRPL